MNIWTRIIVGILAIALVVGAGYAIYTAMKEEPVTPVEKNLPEEAPNNKPESEEKKEEEHKISKYAQMYITLLEHLMPEDGALNHGDFISIDVASLDKEYANEELKETTQVFHIDEMDVEDIVNYLKKYHETIRTNSMDELKELGLMHTEDFPYCDGAIVSVRNIEIIGEDHFKISMEKYRSGLAAIFLTYEVQYVNGAWTYEITGYAIA
ncbi:MAG: hypothetical protein IJ217_00395 [Clostridia bacterium]|nr:hypothetical protein [Clostridia bacterium]